MPADAFGADLDPEGGQAAVGHATDDRAALDPHAFAQIGVDAARPAPGVAEAFAGADVVLLAPSNPVVSIGTVLGVPGLREALLASPARVAGVSPIVGGAVVRGMADRCLPALGIQVSAEGVGRHYGARSDDGLLDAWLVAPDDPADVPGVDVRRVPLLMSSREATTALARAALDAAGAGAAADV
ncbi:MAG TPA: 2-phospho-L-lactate transferase CofD family protein [Blastococcus sp.]